MKNIEIIADLQPAINNDTAEGNANMNGFGNKEEEVYLIMGKLLSPSRADKINKIGYEIDFVGGTVQLEVKSEIVNSYLCNSSNTVTPIIVANIKSIIKDLKSVLKTITKCNKTQVFKDYEEFQKRKDKNINGVSPDYAIVNPDFYQHNTTNEGCWNCIECLNCEKCTDCAGCVNCVNCVECRKCSDCGDCTTCRNCETCRECTNCDTCYNYRRISYCYCYRKQNNGRGFNREG